MKRVVGELHTSQPGFDQNKSSDNQYTYPCIYRSDSQLRRLTPSESCHTSGEDEAGLGLAAALTSQPVLERQEKLRPQSYLLSVGGLAQAWMGPIFPAMCSLTRPQILLLLQWAESKGELEGIKDCSGSWSHLPWLIHEPVACPSCQWSILPHSITPKYHPSHISSQKLPATAQCQGCPYSLFSLISDMTASFLTAFSCRDSRTILFSHRAPTHQGYWCTGGKQDLRGSRVSSCISGLVKAREGTGREDKEATRAAALQPNSLQGCFIEMLLQ